MIFYLFGLLLIFIIAYLFGYVIGKGESVKQNAGLYVIEKNTNGDSNGFSIEPTVPIKEIEKCEYVQFRVVKKLL